MGGQDFIPKQRTTQKVSLECQRAPGKFIVDLGIDQQPNQREYIHFVLRGSKSHTYKAFKCLKVQIRYTLPLNIVTLHVFCRMSDRGGYEQHESAAYSQIVSSATVKTWPCCIHQRGQIHEEEEFGHARVRGQFTSSVEESRRIAPYHSFCRVATVLEGVTALAVFHFDSTGTEGCSFSNVYIRLLQFPSIKFIFDQTS